MDYSNKNRKEINLVLDGEKLKSKEQLLIVLKEALHFPDYFGFNWDALQDCITDLSWLQGIVKVNVVIKNSSKLLNDEEDSPVINTSKEDNSNDAYDLLNKLIEETSNEVSFKDKLSIITVEEGTNVYRDNSTGKFYIENPDEETGFEEVEYTEDYILDVFIVGI